MKPMASVKKPGVNKSAPAMRSIRPSSIVAAGNSPRSRLCLIFVSVMNPCIRNKVTPSPAVNKHKAMVGKAPISLPI